MELKLPPRISENADILVLIEPLWNWNTEAENMAAPVAGLNRTFMELKQVNANVLREGEES